MPMIIRVLRFLVLALSITTAQAQSYPVKPVRIVTQVTGGSLDLAAVERLEAWKSDRDPAAVEVALEALCMAAAPATENRTLLFHKLLAWGLSMSVVGAVVCWVFFGLL